MVTTFGGRAVALGASAVAHAAVVVAAASGGHTPTRAPAATTPELRELTVEVVEVPLQQSAEEAPPRDAHAHAQARAHTHPYPVDPDHDARPHDPSILHHLHAPPVPLAPEASPSAMPDPDVAAATPPAGEPPRFTMAIGGVSPRTASAAPAPGGTGEGDPGSHGDLDEVVPAAAVSVAAKCAGSAPRYTREAELAGVEPDVPLEIVVDTRGRVRGAKVLAPAGYGLDASAVAGALAMRCTPAERAGHAVTVRMRWVTTFRLR